jgi:hypothetical protein
LAQNVHPGQRERGTFAFSGTPQKFIALVRNHGMLCRVLQSRKCPCATLAGSPDLFCKQCKGDGYVYDYQRKLLQADELTSEVKGDRSTVFVSWVPILEPISVERLIAPEQGGNKRYKIEGFSPNTIHISGSPLPLHWNQLRTSYYFDRFEYIKGDQVEVDVGTRTLTSVLTRYDGKIVYGNVDEVHGDLTIIERIYNRVTGYEYTNYEFTRNKIYIGSGQAELVPGEIEVDYYYAPPTPVLPADLDTRNDKESWTSIITSGDIRMSLEPWYELVEGDLITFLSSEFQKHQIIQHNGVLGEDKINEFDVSRLDDIIIDETGRKYFKGKDYYLRDFRKIIWIGDKPADGNNFSVKFLYRPTFTIFLDNPVPNNMENKKYPKTINGKYFNMMKTRDVEKISNTEYEAGGSDSKPVGAKFTEI